MADLPRGDIDFRGGRSRRMVRGGWYGRIKDNPTLWIPPKCLLTFLFFPLANV